MSSGSDSSPFVSWYRSRIGEPTNNDEVYGYWVFVVGVVLVIAGLLWYVLNTGGGPSDRLIGYVLAAGGVVLLLGGSVYRLPLGRLATQLTYLGGLLGLAAVVWFATVFPNGWRLGGSTANLVILLYLLGLAVMAAAAVIAPIIPGRREQEVEERGRDIVHLREELDEREGEIDRLREAVDERESLVEDLRSRLNEAESATEDGACEEREALTRTLNAVRDERDALERELETARETGEAAGERATVAELRLAEVHNSQGTFELYRDTAGEWRWRLVHRNGDRLADSGEGYTERSEAEDAIERVRRYSPAADTLTVGAAAFELFEDETGEHRWRFRHRNGTLLAVTDDGYGSRSSAVENINHVKRNLPNAPERGEGSDDREVTDE